MSFKVALQGLIFAFQLLSTIPLKKQVPYEQGQVRFSAISYPLVGGVLGLILIGLVYVTQQWTTISPTILSLLIVTISIVYSGGLHLDGWMDCSDAFFSYRKQEEKLEIMKDSRIGAFAAISLFLLLSWKTVIVYEVLFMLPDKHFYVIGLIPFFARMIMGSKLYFGELAREKGMAFSMKKFMRKIDWLSYAAYTLLLLASSFLFFQALLPYLLGMLVSSIIFYYLSMNFDVYAFGGITGDTLGASVEGGELWLWMTLLLLLSFGTG